VTHLTRILIADDHPLFRGALRRAVTDVVPDCAIVEAGDFDSIRRELEGNPQMDLVLLDLAMPGVQGFSGLLYLRAQHPSVPVIVVSANDDRGVIRRCLDFQASGFIPKTTEMEAMRGPFARFWREVSGSRQILPTVPWNCAMAIWCDVFPR
jgi:DNA-binding NarL/FixJ family response regulator